MPGEQAATAHSMAIVHGALRRDLARIRAALTAVPYPQGRQRAALAAIPRPRPARTGPIPQSPGGYDRRQRAHATGMAQAVRCGT